MRAEIRDRILILRFKKRDEMNATLDPYSNAYEGYLKNREGHNFPSSYLPKDRKSKFYLYIDRVDYVIGIYGNGEALKHELLHAKYYMDRAYRDEIDREWSSLSPEDRCRITAILKRLGYSDEVIVDEYQAFKYSEPKPFF